MEEEDYAEDSDYRYSSDEDDYCLGFKPPSESKESKVLTPYERSLIGEGSPGTTHLLLRQFRAFGKSPALEKAGISASLLKESLYAWKVFMDVTRGPFCEPELAAFSGQCARLNVKAIVLEVLFPSDYPMAPPFVRVVSPRFAFHTGHVTVGGSICTEVLTPKGWSPALTAETLCITLQAQMIGGDPRLDLSSQAPYSMKEARDAFDRVARAKGWL